MYFLHIYIYFTNINMAHVMKMHYLKHKTRNFTVAGSGDTRFSEFSYIDGDFSITTLFIY